MVKAGFAAALLLLVRALSAVEFSPDAWRIEFYDNPRVSGAPSAATVHAGRLDFRWPGPPAEGIGEDWFSVRCTASFLCPSDDVQLLRYSADDGIRILIDGTPVVDAWTDQSVRDVIVPIRPGMGEHAIEVRLYEAMGVATLRLGLMTQWEPGARTVGIAGRLQAASDLGVPASGKEFLLQAKAATGMTWWSWARMEPGGGSAPFSIPVPEAESDAEYFLSYRTDADLCIGEAWYGTEGSLVTAERALPVRPGQSPLAFPLAVGPVISGIVSLPPGMAGGRPVRFRLHAGAEDGREYSVPLAIDGGGAETRYAVMIPSAEEPRRYRIFYRTADERFWPDGHYKAGRTYGIPDGAQWLRVGQAGTDHVDLDLIRLGRIYGTVRLPARQKAGKDGVKVRVHVYDEGRKPLRWLAVRIPEGSEAAPFELLLPPGRYGVGYDGTEGGEFVRSLFCGESGMTGYPLEARTFELGSRDVDGVVVSLENGVRFSGSLRLPEGTVAPRGGLTLWVYLWDAERQAMVRPSFTIPEGANSVSWSLRYRTGSYYVGYSGVSDDSYAVQRLYSRPARWTASRTPA